MKLFDFFKKKKENQPLEETSTSTVENNLLEIEVKLPEQQNETPEKVEKKQELPEQNAAIRLYSCRKNTKIVPSVFEKAFDCKKLDSVNDAEFVLTLQDDTFLKFRIITDKKETMGQAYGMANFFSKAPVKNQVLKENILESFWYQGDTIILENIGEKNSDSLGHAIWIEGIVQDGKDYNLYEIPLTEGWRFEDGYNSS